MSRSLRDRKVAPMTVDLSDSDDDSAIQIIEDSGSDVEYLPEVTSKTKSKSTSKVELTTRKRPISKASKEQIEDTSASHGTAAKKIKSSEINTQSSPKNLVSDIVQKNNDIVIEDDILETEGDENAKTKGKKRNATSKTSAPKKTRTGSSSKNTDSNPKKTNNSEPEIQAAAGATNKNILNSVLPHSLQVQSEWSEVEYLTEVNNIDSAVARNIISLFKEDNTIPFIARYRREQTGGMDPDQLRIVKNSYDNVKLIKAKALQILKSIDKAGKWTPEIHSAITAAKSLNELEHIYEPYKPGSKRSYAERAKALGLANVSNAILEGQSIPYLTSFIHEATEGLRNEEQVRLGIVHIIADVLSKDKTTFEKIRALRKESYATIETTLSKSAVSKAKKDPQIAAEQKKYQNYYTFKSTEKSIRDYQILAINRGESQKILTVKISLTDWFQNRLRDHCLFKYGRACAASQFHCHILKDSFDDAYNRLIKPFIVRQIRHDLNEKAAHASIEVFANNLKKLLLSPPYRGKPILGIDPGFKHGCKVAVISQHGNLLDTAVMYPHTHTAARNRQESIDILVGLVKKHSCRSIALGNATACRETEIFLTDVIKSGAFRPLNVSYTIVNEAGASIYSCSTEAKSEFPNLDPNLISAVSIARRLQDPLAELVKVEPKHLGVGMYQHDLPEKQLQETLSEIITETVSFVGVDVNTASQCLLRRVAGLNATRATGIIAWRNKIGPFHNRQDLLKVKGIGKKYFEQCAGFIRILPETAGITGENLMARKSLDYLDQTWIHPESYKVARQFVKACGCDIKQLGTDNFIAMVTAYASMGLEELAKKFATNTTSMEVIVKGLCMKTTEDIRAKGDAPLFRTNLRCIDDLSENMQLSGQIRNVTNFGAFVDVGIGKDVLIPTRFMQGRTLSLGEKVVVVVHSIERDRGRVVAML